MGADRDGWDEALAALGWGERSPFDDTLGARLSAAGPERTVVEIDVDQRLHQPTGIVHGGVYASLAESAASVGASLWLATQADTEATGAVGISNHTEFVRAVSDGTLRAEAVPLRRGRQLQLWTVTVADGQGRLVAHSTIRLLNR